MRWWDNRVVDGAIGGETPRTAEAIVLALPTPPLLPAAVGRAGGGSGSGRRAKESRPIIPKHIMHLILPPLTSPIIHASDGT